MQFFLLLERIVQVLLPHPSTPPPNTFHLSIYRNLMEEETDSHKYTSSDLI